MMRNLHATAHANQNVKLCASTLHVDNVTPIRHAAEAYGVDDMRCCCKHMLLC